MEHVTISPGHWLGPAAAASYRRMRDAGLPAGGVTDAGRTFAEQAVLYARYLRGELVATAARPGTSSHESGRALDLSGPARAWVRAHGRDFGWLRDRVRREPWHLEYVLVLDRRLTSGARTPPAPVVTDVRPHRPRRPHGPSQEELMAGPVRIRTRAGGIFLVDIARAEFRPLDPTANAVVDRLGVPIVWDDVSDRDRDLVRQLVIDLRTPVISG